MKIYCPKCKKGKEARIKRKEELFPVKGDEIKILSNVAVCSECGSEVFEERIDEENLKRAYSQYREKCNLLFPVEIREIRGKYNLSQRMLARLLKWGEITIHRYEAGSLQDEVHDEVLKLISEPANMLKIFQKNKNYLPQNVRKKLEILLKGLIKKETESKLKNNIEEYLYSKIEVSEYTGYKKFDLEKMKQMILYILQQSRETYKTKINKLLWYMDFIHFKKFTVSISGDFYIHLSYGPIPDDYEWIVTLMLEERLITSEEKIFDKEKDIAGELIRANERCDKTIFSESELETMNFVLEKLGHLTSGQLSEISHKEIPYVKTKNGKKISYNLAREMKW